MDKGRREATNVPPTKRLWPPINTPQRAVERRKYGVTGGVWGRKEVLKWAAPKFIFKLSFSSVNIQAHDAFYI